MSASIGWHQDPDDPKVSRYWDGRQWTGQLHWDGSDWVSRDVAASAAPTVTTPAVAAPVATPPAAFAPAAAPVAPSPAPASATATGRNRKRFAVAAVVALVGIGAVVVVTRDSGSKGNLAEFCRLSAQEDVSGLDSIGMPSAAQVDSAIDAIDRLKAVAPGEVRGDLELAADVLEHSKAALNGDTSKVDQLEAEVEALGKSEQHYADFVESNCDVTVDGS